MNTPAAPIRVRPYLSTMPDDVRAARVRALWDAVADFPIEVCGDSSEGPLWAAILGRRVATEDEYGFRYVSTFRTFADACAFFDNLAAYVKPLLRDEGGQA